MNTGFVYILLSSKNNHLYIGSSSNPEKRLAEHNAGKTSSTRNKGPWTIAFSQEYNSLGEAKLVENHLKKLKRRDYIEKIIRNGNILWGCSSVGRARRSQ